MRYQLRLARNIRMATLCVVTGVSMLGGCASTGTPGDPLEPINRSIYTFNDGFDTVLLKPAAEIYQGVVPPVARTGVSNVFSNLNDVIVALNNLLQGKFAAGFSDVGRVLINTTAGLFGLFDVATVAGLEKHEEDFGQTLGYWGVGDGPYLVLPFLGPRTTRDAAGLIVDVKTEPLTYLDPVRSRNSAYGLFLVQRRAQLLDASRILGVAALDEYAFVRDAYIQRRRNLIYDGNPPREKFDSTDASKGTMESAEATAAHGVNLRSRETAAESDTALIWHDPRPARAEEERMRQNPVSTLTTGDTATPVVRMWLPDSR